MAKKITVLVLLLFFAVILLSCTKKETSESSAASPVPNTATDNSPVVKKAAVLYGYGFNSPEFVADSQEYLKKFFNIEGSKEIIKPLVYPDDFMSGKRIRISRLADYLEDPEIEGLILLGAPEDAQRPIATMQDKGWDKPVFSIVVTSDFEEDNALGIEYVSSFVIEQSDVHKTIPAQDIFDIQAEALKWISSDVKFKKDNELKAQVEQLLGSNWKLTYYTDIDTGIRSLNHFFIESYVPARVGTIE